jgi:polyhydroxyalkanoate synthase
VPVSGLNIDHQPEVNAMDPAHAISSLPEAKLAILPCRAHEPGFGEDRVSVPNERRSRPASVTSEGQPREAYRFDREFHAMLACLTGGISPVALSLAFIDWASHLAAAPRQQMEIA